MSIHPLVIAELRKRLADLELAAVRLDYRIPGEGASRSASKRYADRQRAEGMADGYRTLIVWAEGANDASEA
ncbi:hypothetical protein [Streptomyces sp. KR55]|uniref:hypothetical protein n=1 Tax=Streptomyces sp. KR55 TaxID=3457425 RepID=UPI003FD2F854